MLQIMYAYVKYEAFGSVIQGGFSFASGRSVMREGWKTHLKIGHSQLRQTIHIRTQDFVFPNFQGLSAP